MEKYIIELLENNVRVVLPDLGAFIVKQRKPLKIIFNEFLKYNDGLLIEYIAKAENIGKEDATKKVTEYVNEVKGKLDKNDPVKITGLGSLNKDQAGNIQFGLEGEEVKKEAPEAKTEKKEEKPKTAKTEKKEPVKETKKVTTQKQEEKPEPPKEPEKPVAKPVVQSKPQYQSKYVTKNSEDDKKRSWLWLGAAVLAILIVVLILYINKTTDKIEKTEVAKGETADTILEDTMTSQLQDEQMLASEVMNDEEITEVYEEPETPAPAVQTVKSTGKRYYIIAGCFKIQSNADNYVIYLRQKGYPAEKLGVIHGYHMVSFNSFSTKSEAVNELNIIRQEYEDQAWLMR